MLSSKSQNGGPVSFERIILALVTSIFVLVLFFSIGMSIHEAAYRPSNSILWEEARPDLLGTPMVDTDGDGISDIEENYVYGTNIFLPDTDGDGMYDGWEVRWFDVRDPLTEELVIDANDPRDAFEDPDGDGYDLDRNGRIDRFDDMVALSSMGFPVDADYEGRNIKRLLQNPPLYDGLPVVLEGVHVMDNGSYRDPVQRMEREVIIQVAEEVEDTARDWLSVVIRPFANRPIHLRAFGTSSTGVSIAGDRVDIQGVFRSVAGASWIEVRGGELFTNIMEFSARYPENDASIGPAGSRFR